MVDVVAAGEEGPHNRRPINGPNIPVNPSEKGVVHLRGRVAIVRREFLLELVHELVVPFAALPSFRGEVHIGGSIPNRNTEVSKGKVVPLIGENVIIKRTETSVVLHRPAFDGLPYLVLFRASFVKAIHHDGDLFQFQRPGGGQPEVTAEHHIFPGKAGADKQGAVLQKVRILLDGCLRPVYVGLRPLAGVLREPAELPVIGLQLGDLQDVSFLSHYFVSFVVSFRFEAVLFFLGASSIPFAIVACTASLRAFSAK